MSLSQQGTVIASVTVPPGTYEIDGACLITGQGPGAQFSCWTTPFNVNPSNPLLANPGMALLPPEWNSTITTQQVQTFATTTTIQLMGAALPLAFPNSTPTPLPAVYAGSTLRATLVGGVN